MDSLIALMSLLKTYGIARKKCHLTFLPTVSFGSSSDLQIRLDDSGLKSWSQERKKTIC